MAYVFIGMAVLCIVLLIPELVKSLPKESNGSINIKSDINITVSPHQRKTR